MKKINRLTPGKLFLKYNYPSWSFKKDCSAIYPPIYQGYNWSHDNIRIKKKNKITNFNILNAAIKRMKNKGYEPKEVA